MQLVPDWAPNVHPMMVHFPIVLVVLAAGADVIRLVLVRRRETLGAVATAMYAMAAAAAGAAVLSGRSAAGTVFTPGLAHGLVADHETWALFATGGLVLLAGLRLVFRVRRRGREGRIARALFAIAGLAALLLIQQTAERGARLVYEFGVGVVPGVTSPSPEGTGSGSAEP